MMLIPYYLKSFLCIIKLDYANVTRSSLLFHLTVKGHPMSRDVQGEDTAKCSWFPGCESTFAVFVACFPVDNRLRHLHVVHLHLCPVANCTSRSTVCIVV